MNKQKKPLCTKCIKKNCYPRNVKVNTAIDIDGAPNFCPMKINSKALEKAWKEYQKKDIREFARQASIQEAECYEWIGNQRRTKNTRIEETIQLAQKLNYKKLGIVFCGGLTYEAVLLNKILENEGFEVVSVSCKTGGIAKEKIGLKPNQKVGLPDEFEPMCNPIAQAEVMNQEKPDWVILMGLCVGHDTLFIKYCDQPVTVFAVKDRVLAHNPLGALYLSGSPYYRRLLQKKESRPLRGKR
jgi:uncharacterized metal-binding protein